MQKYKYIKMFMLLALCSGTAWANEPLDTIFVNDGTSYLIFNDKIYAYGLGNERDFTAIAYENCLQIRAINRSGNNLSSVFVSYGDSTYLQYYYALLTYLPNSMKEFYDKRDDFNKHRGSYIQQRLVRQAREEETEEFHISELKTRSDVIKKMRDEIYDFGMTEDGIGAYLRLIRTDNEYAYLKFVVENSTSVGYNFEHISFQYVQRYKQGFWRKKKEKFTDVFAVVMNSKLTVAAHSIEPMVYIIPTFGIRSDERLVVTFREQRGNRKLVFEVDNEAIMHSEQLIKKK
jgi:hypothetical protein